MIAGIIGVDAPQRRDDAIYDQFVAGFNARLPEAVAQAGYDARVDGRRHAHRPDRPARRPRRRHHVGRSAGRRVATLHRARPPRRQRRRHGGAARERGIAALPAHGGRLTDEPNDIRTAAGRRPLASASRISRRRLFEFGGATVGLAALLAACGKDTEEPSPVGSATRPSPPTCPTSTSTMSCTSARCSRSSSRSSTSTACWAASPASARARPPR